MARGWESKSVESQMEAAEERAALSKKAQLNLEQVARQRERDSLELSRTRVLQDLAAAQNQKYREQLQQSLKFLEDKIKAFPEG